MADTKHLIRRGHTWFVNVALPRSLVRAMREAGVDRVPTHTTRTLGTRDLTVAQLTRHAVVAEIKAEHERLKAVPAQAQVLTAGSPNEAYRRILEEAEEGTYTLRGPGAGMAEEDPEAAGASLMLDHLADRIGEREPSPAEQAQIDALNDVGARAKGRRPRHGKKYGMTPGEAGAAYMLDRQRDPTAGVTKQTQGQEEATFRLFGSYWGDRPLASVERKDVSAFLDKLATLDPDWGRQSDTKEKTFKELLKAHGDHERGLSNSTLNRHCRALAKMWEWAERRGAVEGKNPFAGHARKKPSAKETEWLPFTTEQLNALLAASTETVRPTLHRPAWWVLRIGMFSGMRLNEICSLERQDIRQENGVWFFDITAAKTDAGVRCVPMHSALLGLGLLQDLPENGPIFPELEPGGPDGKRSWYFSKRFGELREKVGAVHISPKTGRDRLSFHSLRTNVGTLLERARVSSNSTEQLLGHKKKSFSFARYSDGLGLGELREDLEAVRYDGLDHGALKKLYNLPDAAV